MILTQADVIADLAKRVRELEDRVLKLEGGAVKSPGSVFVLPYWIDREAWLAYEDMRKAKKKVPTDRARKLIIKKLEKLKAQGNDPDECLNQSSRMDWTDVYAVQEKNNGLQGQAGRGAGGRGRTETRSFYERAAEQSRQTERGARTLLGVFGGRGNLDYKPDKDRTDAGSESAVDTKAERLPKVENNRAS